MEIEVPITVRFHEGTTVAQGVFEDEVWDFGADAEVRHARDYLTIGPIGSEDRSVVLHRTKGGGHRVMVGCWPNSTSQGGTLDQLAAIVAVKQWDTPGVTARYRAEYEAFIALARLRIAEWKAEAAEGNQPQASLEDPYELGY